MKIKPVAGYSWSAPISQAQCNSGLNILPQQQAGKQVSPKNDHCPRLSCSCCNQLGRNPAKLAQLSILTSSIADQKATAAYLLLIQSADCTPVNCNNLTAPVFAHHTTSLHSTDSCQSNVTPDARHTGSTFLLASRQ